MRSVEAIINKFQEMGLRITPQRRIIIKYLTETDQHPTADQIYQDISAAMPDVSPATVYNTVRELVKLEELKEVIDINDSSKRFETNTKPHHHLYCEECHRLTDIEWSFPEIQLPAQAMSGFKITQKKVTFFGICKDCQALNQ